MADNKIVRIGELTLQRLAGIFDDDADHVPTPDTLTFSTLAMISRLNDATRLALVLFGQNMGQNAEDREYLLRVELIKPVFVSGVGAIRSPVTIDLVPYLGSLTGLMSNLGLSNAEYVAKRVGLRLGEYAPFVTMVNPGATGGFAAMVLIDMLGCQDVNLYVGLQDSSPLDSSKWASKGGVLYG